MCHYCERVGHIIPCCFQYLAHLQKIGEKKPRGKKTTKQVWKKKCDIHSYVPYTSLKASEEHDWYFDSGCS